MIFKARRDLDTGDTQDMAFTCGNSYEMTWTGNRRTSDLKYHSDKGEFTLYLADDCTAGINEWPQIEEPVFLEEKWDFDPVDPEWIDMDSESESDDDSAWDDLDFNNIDPVVIMDPQYFEDWDMYIESYIPEASEWDQLEEWAYEMPDMVEDQIDEWDMPEWEVPDWEREIENVENEWDIKMPDVEEWQWDVSARDSSLKNSIQAVFALASIAVLNA